MNFYKETIIGQVLHQVNKDEKNKFYIEQLEELMEDIDRQVYLDELNIPAWNKSGLVITDLSLNGLTTKNISWIFFETEYVLEFSWLVQELNKIYQPKIDELYRLNTTIGFLLKIYDEKYDDLTEIMKMVAIVSSIFLHPDHIGNDRFMVHNINLPKFGSEF